MIGISKSKTMAARMIGVATKSHILSSVKYNVFNLVSATHFLLSHCSEMSTSCAKPTNSMKKGTSTQLRRCMGEYLTSSLFIFRATNSTTRSSMHCLDSKHYGM
jgi:hypothetical protein